MKRLRMPDRRKRDQDEPRQDVPQDRLDRYVQDDPRAQGKATRSPDEIATRRHLEGAEQGPA